MLRGLGPPRGGVRWVWKVLIVVNDPNMDSLEPPFQSSTVPTSRWNLWRHPSTLPPSQPPAKATRVIFSFLLSSFLPPLQFHRPVSFFPLSCFLLVAQTTSLPLRRIIMNCFIHVASQPSQIHASASFVFLLALFCFRQVWRSSPTSVARIH